MQITLDLSKFTNHRDSLHIKGILKGLSVDLEEVEKKHLKMIGKLRVTIDEEYHKYFGTLQTSLYKHPPFISNDPMDEMMNEITKAWNGIKISPKILNGFLAIQHFSNYCYLKDGSPYPIKNFSDIWDRRDKASNEYFIECLKIIYECKLN